MRKVRILLSGNSKLQNYVQAIEGVGAEASATYLPQVDTGYDGLVLCGGNDIDPTRYGQALNGSVNIDHERDAAEFALLRAYVEAGKPVLGICRGHQLINVFFGGTLCQHLPSASQHSSGEGDLVHTVRAYCGSSLEKLYGESFSVNSAHHQAIEKLGEGLSPIALWDGSCIEAVEHSSLPILGVQWHPERMCFGSSREDTVDGARLFEYFVNACKGKAEKT